MKLLLDTHILVWAALDHPSLPPTAADMITDPANRVMVSAASSWEIAIKVRSGRWPEASTLLDQFVDACADLAADILAIEVEHTVRAGLLEWSHRDPFDRMLAAQAQLEGLALVTVDTAFDHDVCRLALDTDTDT